jgi:hypothetical protein
MDGGEERQRERLMIPEVAMQGYAISEDALMASRDRHKGINIDV